MGGGYKIVEKGYIIGARSDRTRRWVECFVKEHKIDLTTLVYMRKEIQAVPEEVYKKVENIKLYGQSWGISFVYAPESGEF